MPCRSRRRRAGCRSSPSQERPPALSRRFIATSSTRTYPPASAVDSRCCVASSKRNGASTTSPTGRRGGRRRLSALDGPMITHHLLSVLLALPVLGAFLIAILPRSAGRLHKILGILITLVTFVLSWQLVRDFVPGPAMQFQERMVW